jgi:hypothetical protein
MFGEVSKNLDAKKQMNLNRGLTLSATKVKGMLPATEY